VTDDDEPLWYECVQIPVRYEDDGECRISHCDPETGRRVVRDVPDGTACMRDVPCKSYACHDGVCILKGTKPCPDEHERESSLSKWAIIGIVLGVLGGVLLLALIAVIVIYVTRRDLFVVFQ
jgi:hypothetical protein